MTAEKLYKPGVLFPAFASHVITIALLSQANSSPLFTEKAVQHYCCSETQKSNGHYVWMSESDAQDHTVREGVTDF